MENLCPECGTDLAAPQGESEIEWRDERIADLQEGNEALFKERERLLEALREIRHDHPDNAAGHARRAIAEVEGDEPKVL
jgi:hypothetical protein